MSGYIEQGEDPLQRAKIEIEEEVGLSPAQVNLIRSGEPLREFDEQKGIVWIVHPFLFETADREIRLDWEHTESRWIDLDELSKYETVPKLKEALERVRWDLRTIASASPGAMSKVDELARDRVHGASRLCRRSIQILTDVAQASKAQSADELFSSLLSVALELRKAQPSMATIRNLTGRFLYDVDVARKTAITAEQLKETAMSRGQKLQVDAEKAAEDTSRKAATMLPEEGYVLTHSYSDTVRRAVELGVKSRRNLTVYVTESSPGLEGKRLAGDLIAIGVPVKLIADSAVGAVISDVDMVLVGADSVLADGSVINKIGTRKIAALAEREKVPFFVTCESTKFSTVDFLGETVSMMETLYDRTPSECVSNIVTESGSVEPRKVEHQIRVMLSQLYP